MSIIHDEAMTRLKEKFSSEQMREISFALNPDSENLDWTIYRIEEKSEKLYYELGDLQERVKELVSLVKDYKLLSYDEFIEDLNCHVDDLKLVVDTIGED